ncbi:MAG: TolB family protein, partial [Actinomycetota bacterium]
MRLSLRISVVLALVAFSGASPLPAHGSAALDEIAFRSDRDGNAEIYVMNAEGKDLARITNNAAEDTSPKWSPERTRLVFTSTRDGNA